MTTIFDCTNRTEKGAKKRSEDIFTYWNRSALPSNELSRELMENFFSHIPPDEQNELCARFRSGDDAALAAAFQEVCLHEFFLLQECKQSRHLSIPGTTDHPDFFVVEPGGSEFILEAQSPTAVSTGPSNNPRRNRMIDFLRGTAFDGFSIGVDELTAGSKDLRQNLVAEHIRKFLRSAVREDSSYISIPPLKTDDGWSVALTAIRGTNNENGGIRYEAWNGRGEDPSRALLCALKKKGGRYGDDLAMPFVIAINSWDSVLADSNFEATLFGRMGFWGTAETPHYRRVSAVLFTKNLWPATLLMGQVESRLYLNPWAHFPYKGVLTQLDTFNYKDGSLLCSTGLSINKLLKLRLYDSTLWS